MEEGMNKVLTSRIGKAEWVPPSRDGEKPTTPGEWSVALEKSIVTTIELHSLKLIPRDKILGDWWCEGDLGIEYGPRGAGKTWIAIGMGGAISTGGQFGEWKAPKPQKVLYVDAEMPPDLIRARCEGMSAVNNNFEILNHEILFERSEKTINLIVPEQQQAITDRCLRSNAKVLIVDNLSTATSGMKENDSDSWELINRWLLSLRRLRISVVLLHHAGRSGQMRGTSRREDNVFWIICITDLKKESESKLGTHCLSTFTKQSRNTQTDTPSYKWHFETDTVSRLVKVTHEVAQSLDMFLDVIRSGVTKPIEIARLMGMEDYAVSRMAKKAMDLNLIERVNRGEYAVLERPNDETAR
jgi:putative DNA primase/helicase